MVPVGQIQLSKANLEHNLRVWQWLARAAGIVAVAKANAYGHGDLEIVQMLQNSTIKYIQLDDLPEWQRIKDIAHQPILILGNIMPEEVRVLAKQLVQVAIYDLEQLEGFAKLNQPLEIHLAVDVAMGREGLLLKDLPVALEALKKYPQLSLKGLYGHLANSKDMFDRKHTGKQLALYEEAVNMVHAHGWTDISTHLSASGGVLSLQHTKYEHQLVRIGAGLYGLWPSEEFDKQVSMQGYELKPVLRWVSRVAQVKEFPAGSTIGYGLTYITKKPTRMALIPQGYSDGYDRRLSNCGEVLVQGKRCPVRGRIAMNMFMVEVTQLAEVRAGEEVVLIGDQGDEHITVDQIASKIDTIGYEVTARISPLLPRVIIN